jgi:hypothetical protein
MRDVHTVEMVPQQRPFPARAIATQSACTTAVRGRLAVSLGCARMFGVTFPLGGRLMRGRGKHRQSSSCMRLDESWRRANSR